MNYEKELIINLPKDGWQITFLPSGFQFRFVNRKVVIEKKNEKTGKTKKIYFSHVQHLIFWAVNEGYIEGRPRAIPKRLIQTVYV